jgi:hypothetical protein
LYGRLIGVQLIALLVGADLACRRASFSCKSLWPGDWEVVLDIVEVLCVEIAGSERAMVAAKVFVVITRGVSKKVLEAHVRKIEED